MSSSNAVASIAGVCLALSFTLAPSQIYAWIGVVFAAAAVYCSIAVVVRRTRPTLREVGLGILLVAGGLLGFLPVLGFWMIPLGFLVLSVDLPVVRRWRRQLTVWGHRRKGETDGVEKASNEKAG